MRAIRALVNFVTLPLVGFLLLPALIAVGLYDVYHDRDTEERDAFTGKHFWWK